MNSGDAFADDRAARLREAFDQAFARAPAAETVALGNFLVIRMGTDRHVLRLTDMAGLFVDKKITWLPSPVPELLGVAGFRGTVRPVYDLGMLLGYPRAATPRWLVIAAAAPVGLAFESFEGLLRAEVAQQVIDVASVLETIGRRAAHDRQTGQT